MPSRPLGLIIVTDPDENCIAVVDPESHRLVPTLSAPIPLPARSMPDRLVVRTAPDRLDALAALRRGTLPIPLPGEPDRPGLTAAPTGIEAVRPLGTYELFNQFSGIFPDQGPYSGGTLVTVIGSHFSGATDVFFGTRRAASFSVLDDQTIVAVSPSGAGAVPVTVTTPGGTAPIGSFFYIPWPTLTDIAPAAGPIGGGDIVELTGVHLSTARLVHFGDSVAFPTAVSDEHLLVTAPPASGPGTVPVYVITVGGVSNRLLYTYAAVPAVTGVSPTTGSTAGGEPLVLTGTGLSHVTAVTIGGVPATSFGSVSDTLLVVVTPPNVPGPADITVTTAGGSVTVPGGFDYRAPSTTAVTSAPDPSVVGRPVTFTAVVAGVPPTATSPTGTVTFDFGDGGPTVAASLTGGTATVSHAYAEPSTAPYTITAEYSGDRFFTPSTGTDTQTVDQAATTTTVASGPDPSAPGQPVTFVAQVAPAPPGAGAPTGTVTFDFGDGTPAVTLPLANGAATATHAYAEVTGSPYPVTATYNGDADFTPSTGTDTQTVDQAATATAVTAAPDPSLAGQPVTVTATVTAVPPGAGTPTGTVTFDFGDGTPTVTEPLSGNTATTPHTYTGASGSPYTITATYNGDTDFTPSTGTDTQSVGQSPTTTAVASAPDPTAVGEPVTATATVTAVSPGAGTPTGTVTFDFGDGTPTVTQPVSAGQAAATHTYTGASGSPYAITATYNGDADFLTSSGTDAHTVQPAATETAVTTAPDPSAVGDPVTFTATVTAVPPGAGTPTGTVTFDPGDGTPPLTAPLSGDTATATYPYTDTAGSPYTVTATYNGDTDFTASSGTDTQTVEPAATTLTIASLPNPSTVGQETTFLAKIAPGTPAAGSPTGTVTFEFSDAAPPVTAPVTGGTAAVTRTNPEVAQSPYTVTATYSGDPNFTPSTGADTHQVVQAVSTTVVTASPSPSVTGQPVTFTATVAAEPPSSGTPTGTVTFDFGDGTAPVALPLTDTTATTDHAYATAVGSPYTVTVTYDGDANFVASVGARLHTVDPAATITTITASPDPSVTGELVTVTVAPTGPGAGTPTGPVTIDFGDGTPTVTAELVNGTAAVTHAYTGTAGSPYTIAAEYGGDGDFAPSENTLVHAVAPAATTTVVTSSPTSSAVGQTVTLIARVAPVPPGAGAPTGTVTFDFGDGTPTATAPVANGVALTTHAYTSTAGSPYTITASYSGDDDFAASTGTDAQQVEMSVSATSTTVTSAPDPSVVGEAVTFTATVAVLPPAAGTATGTVTFDFGDGTPTVTVPLTGDTAATSHAYASTAGSPYTITAAYSGDDDFTGSTGLDTQTVTPAPSSTTLSSAPNPSVTGEPVTFTATVASGQAGAGTPTGTVTLDFGDGSPPVRAPLADGTAIAVHAYPGTAGSPYTVTATYDGDASFTGSTDALTQTVSPAATSTTVFSSPDPSQAGQPVTVTASVAVVAPGSGTTEGTVTFDFGDGTPTVTAPSVAGVATVTHAYTDAPGSPYTITATYDDDGAFAPSTGTDVHTVQPASTTTTVTAGPDPSMVGEEVTVTATVAAVPPGAGVPSGTVTLDFGDGTAPVDVVLAGGAAIVAHTYASSLGSPYTITATYGGSDDFRSSVGTEAQTVPQSATTTMVSSAPEPSVVGQPVTFTATVAPVAPGGGSPTGTVTFDFGDGSAPAAAPVVGGLATAEHAYTTSAGSPYPVTATYGGDPDFTGSGDLVTHSVGRAPTTTAVISAPDPSVAGEPVTLTATVAAVSPGAGTPTGTVTFDPGDGTAPATAPLTAGVATITHVWADTSGSPYTVTADYGGDADFTASTGTDTHTVTPAATHTDVVSSPDPSVAGEPVTLTATVAAVSPGAGTPTGTVTFDPGDGTTPITTSVTGGVATVTHAYTDATGSPYTITATYDGDADFLTSLGTDAQTVGRASATIAVSDPPEPSVTGQPVTFLARVTPVAPGTGAPTGTVTYDFGDGTAPVVAPVADGVATAVHAYATAAGSPYTVTADYSGDDHFIGSVITETHLVERASATTTVDSSPNPSVTGQPVTVTATVAAVAPGAGTPTGTVTFDFGDGTGAVTAPVTGGVATTTHAYPIAFDSPYTITADYSGDADFTPSTGTATQVVGPAATDTTVTSSPDPSVAGQSVTVQATVSPTVPGDGIPTGSVIFDPGDGTPLITAPLIEGSASITHTYPSTSGSPYTLTATYSGDTDFTASSGTDTQTVGQAASATALVTSPDPSVAGEQVTFTARVSAVAPGDGAPSGTVTFDFGDGTPTATAPVTGGVATVTHPYATSAGSPFTVTAAYGGDADFAPSSTTSTHTVLVSAATTSTTVTSSPDPSVTGRAVTFTATVAPTPPGAGVPTGTVTFDFGDGTATATASLSGGVATVVHSYTTAVGSPYTVTAAYSGDVNFSSSAGTDTQTVDPASTTTTVASAPDPSVVGQPVALTATVAAVAPGAGVPTGTVTFDFGDGAPVASAPLAGGVATISHPYPSAGGFTVTATYNGGPSFLSSSGTGAQTVGKAATTTAVVSAPDPTVSGQPVTLTATVVPIAPGTGVPTGTVTFDFGDGTATVTAPLADGLASLTRSYAGASGSPYTVTATYNGDTNYTASTGTDVHTVNRAATTTAVSSTPDPSVTGQTVTLTATVSALAPGAGAPTGTVTFSFGDGTPAITAPLSGGTATATHAYGTATGSPLAVTATYNGGTSFAPSTGTATQTVGKAATTTTVTSAPDPSVTGQTVTLTATVAPVSPGAGAPTGTVTFSFGDGTPAATAPVTGGVATVTHAYAGTSGSPYPVTATYDGDSGYTSSSGTATQTVGKAATTTTVASAPDPSVTGQTVTLTATVASVLPGAGIPTGTVTFSFGDGTPTVTAPLSGGTATTTHAYTTRTGSPFPITATYNGDTNYTASTGTDTQTVGRATTTTTVVSAPDPSATGQSVTLTATVASVSPGAGTPTGTVTFSFGDGTSNSTVSLSGGVATVNHTYTTRTGSPFPITATYNGDTNFNASSGTDTQTINAKAATTTTVTSTPDPSVVGQPVTIRATVSSASGTPVGAVTFSFGDGTNTAVNILSGGIATVTHTYTTTTGSPFTITATYHGTENFATSSGTDTQTVGKAVTTTAVSSSPNPSTTGDPVTVTATVAAVAPGTGTPTGTVTIAITGRSPQTVPLVGNTASATFNPLQKGTHTVTAKYNGDVNYAASSATTTQTVNTGQE
ncbi:Ig-like domain repeat protein [Streptomyces sp. PRKS01-29]|nr:Ig-like domain repeat protein [Streptomyces sabulosicollis]MBI0295058.1 Ig-like domain repeat protein [Streptomyces sabulosicollis]